MSGTKHPWLFGNTAEEGWHEVWHSSLKYIIQSDVAFHQDEEPFLLQRSQEQSQEECHFTVRDNVSYLGYGRLAIWVVNGLGASSCVPGMHRS